MANQENDLITQTQNQENALSTHISLSKAGQIANRIAFSHVFQRFMQEKSVNTLKRHQRDLQLFADFLRAVSITLPQDIDFQQDLQAWQGITWGLVEGFVTWLLNEGYAINSVNARLSTVRVYAKLAVKGGAIPQDEGLLIQNVKGFSRKAGMNADDMRAQTRKGTISYTYAAVDGGTDIQVDRRNTKKSSATSLTEAQAYQMTSMRSTAPQAARDALLMCLLLEHGLRASEVALLSASAIDLDSGQLQFTRPKVRGTDHEQATHQMTDKMLVVATTYIKKFYPPTLLPHGPLVLGTTRLKKDGSGGELRMNGLNRSKITKRVAYLGRELGIDKLSAHDCRHYCATRMARLGYGVDELMAWFGWTNAQTAVRYVHSTAVLQRNKG